MGQNPWYETFDFREIILDGGERTRVLHTGSGALVCRVAPRAIHRRRVVVDTKLHTADCRHGTAPSATVMDYR